MNGSPNSWHFRQSGAAKLRRSGGQGGIRTHGGREPTAVFKTAALNHSATCPCAALAPPRALRKAAALDSAQVAVGPGRATGAPNRVFIKAVPVASAAWRRVCDA